MKYLLDTHAFLWYFEDSHNLSKAAIEIIEDTDAQKYVSIASLWEFAIKYSSRKIRFDGGLEALWEMILKNGFEILPITQSYLLKIITELPFIHKDPFDRVIIATAQTEKIGIVTTDENIKKYDVECIW
ncbi:MAG: type II toxin-antitoxin system VapC family toxin [Oscillospiraceae bacterium]|nr:type II toxin-antitoxin system VapC family toxin [Oscillospiraceae bacterium]